MPRPQPARAKKMSDTLSSRLENDMLRRRKIIHKKTGTAKERLKIPRLLYTYEGSRRNVLVNGMGAWSVCFLILYTIATFVVASVKSVKSAM